MKGQMESAVKDYDSSVPRMKAKLPAMKEVRDKKAKKVGARRPSFRRLSWRTLRRRRLILAIHTGQVRRPEQGPAREEGAGRQGGPEEGARAASSRALRHRRDASYSRRPRTRNAPTRRRGKKKRRSRRRPMRRRKRSRAAARAGRRSRVCSNYTLFNKTNTRRSPPAPPRAFQQATPRRCARERFSAAAFLRQALSRA